MATELIENCPYDQIHPGQSAELERTLTRDDVAMFSTVSGDLNPTHTDKAFASGTDASGVTGHALWGGSLISNLLGNVLPGPGTVYRHQAFTFERPVALGDTVCARIVVREKRPNNVVVFDCFLTNQRGETVFTGEAEVTAPREKISLPKVLLPNVRVEHHDSYVELFELTAGLDPVVTAVAHPCELAALQGPLDAATRGLIRPLLIGPELRIREVAEEHGLDLADHVIINVEHSHAAAAHAVELVKNGEAALLMKGSLHTEEMMSAVVSSKTGIRTERRISHVYVMDVPTYHKLLFITDVAINIQPDLDIKRDICQNAIELAHTLGVTQPKVAILAAVETVRSNMVSTLDAAALCKMADRNQITGAILDGPLAMDNAISVESAKTKGIVSPVAGDADILLVPDLEAGNILSKQLTFLGGADAAGVVLGARVPVIVTSRSDNVRTRLASCAVAVAHAHAIMHGNLQGF